MVILVETPLRTLVERYLSDGMTFLEFEEQFVPSAWDVVVREGTTLADMADAVLCLLVDYRDARITEDAFKAGLWQVIGIDDAGAALSTTTLPGSSSTSANVTFPTTVHSADTRS